MTASGTDNPGTLRGLRKVFPENEDMLDLPVAVAEGNPRNKEARDTLPVAVAVVDSRRLQDHQPCLHLPVLLLHRTPDTHSTAFCTLARTCSTVEDARVGECTSVDNRDPDTEVAYRNRKGNMPYKSLLRLYYWYHRKRSMSSLDRPNPPSFVEAWELVPVVGP